MSPGLPERAHSVLADSEKHFMKRDAPVVKRLLNCQDSGFIDAFWHIDKNIKKSLCSAGLAWAIFLQLLVEYSTNYVQAKKNEINDAKQEYEEKLAEISKIAKALSRQIRAAELLAQRHGFSVDADYHPFELLKNAADNQADAETRDRFYDWIAGGLDDARKEFDLKYFPNIPNIINEISRQYSTGFYVSEDAMTPKRAGKINLFCMHFFKAISHQIEISQLPSTILDITEQELADVLRVSLGDESICAQDVKNFKQSQKRKKFI
jgi:hypothetical protein